MIILFERAGKLFSTMASLSNRSSAAQVAKFFQTFKGGRFNVAYEKFDRKPTGKVLFQMSETELMSAIGKTAGRAVSSYIQQELKGVEASSSKSKDSTTKREKPVRKRKESVSNGKSKAGVVQKRVSRRIKEAAIKTKEIEVSREEESDGSNVFEDSSDEIPKDLPASKLDSDFDEWDLEDYESEDTSAVEDGLEGDDVGSSPYYTRSYRNATRLTKRKAAASPRRAPPKKARTTPTHGYSTRGKDNIVTATPSPRSKKSSVRTHKRRQAKGKKVTRKISPKNQPVKPATITRKARRTSLLRLSDEKRAELGLPNEEVESKTSIKKIGKAPGSRR